MWIFLNLLRRLEGSHATRRSTFYHPFAEELPEENKLKEEDA